VTANFGTVIDGENDDASNTKAINLIGFQKLSAIGHAIGRGATCALPDRAARPYNAAVTTLTTPNGTADATMTFNGTFVGLTQSQLGNAASFWPLAVSSISDQDRRWPLWLSN
jgi:hypothetical protein